MFNKCTLKIQNLTCDNIAEHTQIIKLFKAFVVCWTTGFLPLQHSLVNQCTTTRYSVVQLPNYHTTHASSDTIWNPIHTNSLTLYKLLWSRNCVTEIQSKWHTSTFSLATSSTQICDYTHRNTQKQSVYLPVLSLRVVLHRAEIRMEGPVGESLPGPLAMTLLLPFVDKHTHIVHTNEHSHTKSVSHTV